MMAADEFIYRAPGNRGAKDISLHRERDWLTGLSFLNYPYGIEVIRFKIAVLRVEGYIVREDGLQPVKSLSFLGGVLYIEPNSGESLIFPEGHYTVYHPDKDYWNQWHDADANNMYSTLISTRLQVFYSLRDK